MYISQRAELTVLFIVACPRDQVRLALDEEIRAVSRRLAHTRVRLITALAATYEDLREALREVRPGVVHIACHGEASGDIWLSDGHQGSERVPGATLAELLAILRHNLRLVVINACFSGSIAGHVAPVVGAAIGMSEAIRDEAAVRFSATLYASLAADEPIEQAFRLAVNDLGCLGEDHVPVLLPASLRTEPLAEALAPPTATAGELPPPDAAVTEAAELPTFTLPLADPSGGDLDLLALAESSAASSELRRFVARHLPALRAARINGLRSELRLAWRGRALTVTARPSLYFGPGQMLREVSLMPLETAAFVYCPRGAHLAPRYEFSLACRPGQATVELRVRAPDAPVGLRLNLV